MASSLITADDSSDKNNVFDEISLSINGDRKDLSEKEIISEADPWNQFQIAIFIFIKHQNSVMMNKIIFRFISVAAIL